VVRRGECWYVQIHILVYVFKFFNLNNAGYHLI
jgi:hypothetical protein